VILSAGVNDIAFGPILTFCVMHPGGPTVAKVPPTPCELAPATPKLDSLKRVDGFSAGGTSSPTLGAQLATLQKALPARYGQLAAALAQPLGYAKGGLGVAPPDVYITQYPDFTNGSNGQPCGTGAAGFAASTWSWLGMNAAELNRTVKVAAAGKRWTLVPVNTIAFAKRGYCAGPNSLFVDIATAYSSGCLTAPLFLCDTAGPFHPNAEADDIQAREVDPLLCKGLGLTSTCKDS